MTPIHFSKDEATRMHNEANKRLDLMPKLYEVHVGLNNREAIDEICKKLGYP